jgi:hypothetical protein
MKAAILRRNRGARQVFLSRLVPQAELSESPALGRPTGLRYLGNTERLQRRSAWRAKSPNIPHRRLAEETAVFAI